MRKWAAVAVLVAGALVAGGAGLGGAANAQAANGTLTGTVAWANGTPATDATVRAVGSGQTFTTRTNVDGRYELSVPAGEYTLVAFADGETSEPRSVGLSSGERVTVDAELRDENAPPPDDANVTAQVRKTVRGVAAGDTARLSFSSDEEDAVGIRRLSVSFRAGVDETDITVANVEGGPVEPPGRTVRLLYIDAGETGAVSGMSFLLRVEQAAVGDGTLRLYAYEGGSWQRIQTEPVVSTSEATLLQVDVTGTGYVAVVSETTTTTVTAWISTGTPSERESLVGSGLRTGLGIVALAGAVALAVLAGRE